MFYYCLLFGAWLLGLIFLRLVIWQLIIVFNYLVIVIWSLVIVFNSWFENCRNIVPGRVEAEKERHVEYVKPNFVNQGITEKAASEIEQNAGYPDDLEHGFQFTGKGRIDCDTFIR